MGVPRDLYFQLRAWLRVGIGVAFMAVGSRTWAEDLAESASARKPAYSIRSVELYWDTLDSSKLKKLKARLQKLVGRSFAADDPDVLTKELNFLWDAGPNMGGKIWGEPAADGVKLIISVRGVLASELPKHKNPR